MTILVFHLLSNIGINAARVHFYDLVIYLEGTDLVPKGIVVLFLNLLHEAPELC